MSQSFNDLQKTAPVQPKGLLANTENKKPKPMPHHSKPKEELTPDAITFYVTEAERAVSKKKAGLVSESKFLRHFLREKGYFDER